MMPHFDEQFPVEVPADPEQHLGGQRHHHVPPPTHHHLLAHTETEE